MRAWATLAVVCGSLAGAPRALAHDLWLVPPEQVEVGRAVRIACHVGSDFPQSEHAPDPAKFKRRLLFLPDGTEGRLEPAGQQGTSAFVEFVPAKPGGYVAAVETEPKLIALNAQAFNDYLVSDGLPHIYLLRAKEQTLDQPAKERYSKYVKAVLAVGGDAGDPCRVVGMTLEIVPLRDPLKVAVGNALPVK